jgi:hypothetical protein
MILDADSESTTGTPTDAPSVGPTMPPAFDLQGFARDSSFSGGLVLSAETVLELVPNISWSEANLDLVEMNVIRHIDGISPLSLLETIVGISRDELEVMLAMLLARQLVMVVSDVMPRNGWVREPTSGVFNRASLGIGADGELAPELAALARTG